jgi:hypothetical protein
MGVSKMAKRKRYADYMRAIVDADAKWVTDSFARDRRICLYGIGIALTQEGSKVSIDPVIPCAGPLAALVRKHPKARTFAFDRKKRTWRLSNVGKNFRK